MIRLLSVLIRAFQGIALLGCSLLLAQAPDTLWTRTFGGIEEDEGHSICQTSDGGYVIVGRTTSFGAGGSDIWMLKADANGDTIWSRTFGNSFSNGCGNVQQTSDNGYIIIGSKEITNFGPRNLWLIKTNSVGDTIWTKIYGDNEDSSGDCIRQTSDGGYIILGTFETTSSGPTNLWLLKTDQNGDTLWTKKYGGNNNEYGESVQITSDGSYIILATTESFGAGGEDIWLIKTTNTGNTTWIKTFGGIDNDDGVSVEQTTDNGYIISGKTESYGIDGDIWVIKTDDIGDTLWTNTYGGIDEDEDGIIKQTADGGYILVGETESFGLQSNDIWVVRLTDTGDTLWTKLIGGNESDGPRSLEITSEGGYIICGRTRSYGAGESDFYLVKIDAEPTSMILNDLFQPNRFYLKQNYPNPFNPSTKIKYELPKLEKVKIEVFNLLGQKISTLLNKQMPSGLHEVEFTARDIPSGVYMYRMEAGEFTETKKLILIR